MIDIINNYKIGGWSSIKPHSNLIVDSNSVIYFLKGCNGCTVPGKTGSLTTTLILI